MTGRAWRPTVRELIAAVALAAVALGWWVDHARQAAEAGRLRQQGLETVWGLSYELWDLRTHGGHDGPPYDLPRTPIPAEWHWDSLVRLRGGARMTSPPIPEWGEERVAPAPAGGAGR